MDEAKFFDQVRHNPFPNKLSGPQVIGMSVILEEGERRRTPRNHLAYMLATAYHETAATMFPIIERGSRAYFNKYEANTPIGRRLGNTKLGDGYRYRGRGFVQLTGRTNYERVAHILNIDALNNPEVVLLPQNAAEILFAGMDQGWFTGKALDDFIDGKDEGDAEDWREFVAARRIINGTDKAQKIAGHAIAFEHALEAAGYEESSTSENLT